MSRGIGDYIQSIMASVETKITPEMRTFSLHHLSPILQSELHKVDPNSNPRFEFEKERDGELVDRLSV